MARISAREPDGDRDSVESSSLLGYHFSKSSAQQPLCFRRCTGECKHSLFRTPLHNARSGGGVAGSLDCPVDHRPGDADEFSDLRGRVFAPLVDPDQVLLLLRGQFGLLAAQPASRGLGRWWIRMRSR